MHRVDAANTGHAPNESGPVEGAVVKWSKDVEKVSASAPAVAGGTVYLGDFGGIEKFDTKDATKTYWDDEKFSTSIAVRDGKVYASAQDGLVYAFDEMLYQDWHYRTHRFGATAPTVVDGTVYVSSFDGTLYALRDPGTDSGEDSIYPAGDLLWSFDVASPADRARAVSPPAVVDGTVYVSGIEGTYAVSADDGTELWSTDVVGDNVAVRDGSVYIGTVSGVTSLSAASGDEEWSNDVASGAVAVTDETVYVNSSSGVRAIDPADGSILWRSDAAGAPRLLNVGTPPVVSNNVVYAGGDKRFFAVDAADGSTLWSLELEGSLVGTPAIADGGVYLTNFQPSTFETDAVHKLYALTEA